MFSRILHSIFVLSSLLICFINCNPVQDESFRLPNNSYPLKYAVWLKVNIEEMSTFFEGRVKIHTRIKETSNSITIHSRNLKISDITATDLNSTIKYKNLSYQFENSKDFLIIQLPFTMHCNNEIVLDISYNGSMNEASEFYLKNKGFMTAKVFDYIYTEFEPTKARSCFPCFDEPAKKANFNLQLEHDSSYNAIANMPVISRVQSNELGDYVITTFEETPVMSSYLLAFFISKFKYKEAIGSEIPQTIYAREYHINDKRIKYLANNLNIFLKKFEELLGLRYSLPKLDHVIAPYYYSAIENWGVMGYSERIVIYSERPHTIMCFLHEIAHHYFGNLVTPKWWSYTWMKEGFAKFYEVEIAKMLFPKNAKDFESIMEMRYNLAKEHDLKLYSKSLNYYVESLADINDKYHTLTYLKGASIVRMFQEAIGAGTWRKGMNYFLIDNQYGSVEPSNLHKAVQRAVDEDYLNSSMNIESLMSPWEDQAGYPVIYVKLENGNLKMTQRRKLHDENISNEIYSIPIFYASSSDPNFENSNVKFWMTEKEMEIKNFTDNWIIINHQRIGYYDVDYDSNLWNLLINQLNVNHSVIIQPIRQRHVKEFLEAYEREKWSCMMLLRIVRYLKSEDDLKIIKYSLNKVSLNLNECMSDETFQLYFKNVLKVLYDKLRHYEQFKAIHNSQLYR